jgi:hypothetical protein
MRYFTPDILIRGNASDDTVSDAADDEWDAASTAYQARLAELNDRLPDDVRDLLGLCLHDGELLAWGDPGALARATHAVLPIMGRTPRVDRSVVAVRLDDVVTSIEYQLAGPVASSPQRTEKPFTARDHVAWLYDEVDQSPGSATTYLHRVLLSDGREVEVPFTSVSVRRFPLLPPSSDLITPANIPVRRTA